MFGEDIPYEPASGETSYAQRESNWETSSGLQAVDGLKTSAYAEELGSAYVAGEQTSQAVIDAIDVYYRNGHSQDAAAEQADKVTARMVAALENLSFSFRPIMLASVHKELFDGVLDPRIVGTFRDGNITKKEPVLGGRSVVYGDAHHLTDLLEYDFAQEKSKRYDWPLTTEQVHSLARFTSSIWQAHPFFEGNTRTTALFLQLYLRSMGIPANNEPFKKHSRFFRDALVRSNYANIREGIHEDQAYLNAFFENLLLDAAHNLDSMNLTLS